jgi:hypothetical protein
MSPTNVASGQSPAQDNVADKPGWWERFKSGVSVVDREVSFVKGLSLFTILSSVVVGYFQYVSAYQDKVKAEAEKQISDAQTTYADISATLSKAITLQQYLFFDYRDAVAENRDGDEHAMEAKHARSIYQPYDDLRVSLRESIDLLAHKVETTLDWRSNPWRDAATAPIGDDPMTRLALGHYDFECDSEKYMPCFELGHTKVDVPPSKAVLKDIPNAKALGLDWYSSKHQLLVLYYCFEVLHRRIATPLAWAAPGTVSAEAKKDFRDKSQATLESLNREAVRLNMFMTLAARRVENIQVKFRPRGWYCHIPVLREVLDGVTGIWSAGLCMPLRVGGASGT